MQWKDVEPVVELGPMKAMSEMNGLLESAVGSVE
jgi:hypothetical protein